MPERHDAGDFVSPDILNESHRAVFETALKRILETEIAEHTYAEILDGLPTSSSYREFHSIQEGHPSLEHHELCPGTRERAREFRSAFDVSVLRFPFKLISAFQKTKSGSREFQLRLIELVVVSCHQIAVYLFQLDDSIHKHEDYVKWRDAPWDMKPWDSFRPPTAFSNRIYVAIEQYPNGVADTVGYWAEARIFGGVVVFDRGENEDECRDVYIHCCLTAGPRTLYPPTTEQYNDLMRFLLEETNEDSSANCPLPILASSKNRWRWDAWDAIARFHIFRDKYERRVRPTKPKAGCYKTGNDWPEIADELFLVNAMHDQRNGLPVDEAAIAAAKEGIKQITPSSPLWREGYAGDMAFEGI